MNWENFRDKDGNINLLEVWFEEHHERGPGSEYLSALEDRQRIKSRQAAAVAIATAEYFQHITAPNKRGH